jgi:hypothetical protein
MLTQAVMWFLLVRANGVDVLYERVPYGGEQGCINRAKEFMAEYKAQHPNETIRYQCKMVRE